MNEDDNIKYNNNFLAQVIMRIDFTDFIDTSLLFSSDILATIRANYTRQSIPIKTDFNSLNINIPKEQKDNPIIKRDIQSGISVEFIDASMKNKVTLSNKFVIFEFNQYKSFKNSYETISTIIQKIFSKITTNTQRIGLRYVNIFEQDKIKISKNLFNAPINSSIYYKDNRSILDKYQLARAMSLIEYFYDNTILNIRYGFYNPEYPSTLNKNNYVIDFDYYTQEQMHDDKQILIFLENGHTAIQNVFESIITDKLREKMNINK